jgi:hypothetical protein
MFPGETSRFDWLDGIAVGATVCGCTGVCLYMDEQAARVFAKDGGPLVGRNLLDCHPKPGRSRFAAQLAAPMPNSYTIEKHGVRKLIHQLP